MIGKFNSAEELLKSYNELEKSFTQKCQQLKELQKRNEATISSEQKVQSIQSEQTTVAVQSEQKNAAIQSEQTTVAIQSERKNAAIQSERNADNICHPERSDEVAQSKDLRTNKLSQQSGTSENSPPRATGNSIDSVPPEKEAADVQSDNVPYEENGAAAEVQVDCAVPANNDALFAANDGRAPRQTPALPKVMINGGNVSMALPSKPKTLKEASVLAKKIFEN